MTFASASNPFSKQLRNYDQVSFRWFWCGLALGRGEWEQLGSLVHGDLL